MPKFDYAGYFNRIREIERLVIPAEKINWLERYSKPEKPVDVLLYLGCNVLMTAPGGDHQDWPAIRDDFLAKLGPLSGRTFRAELLDVAVGNEFIVAVQRATASY
jgi:hypothetical protein